MDTKDAMSSYQPKERRLEILKDAHIGAFAAMNVVCYLLLFFAAATELGTLEDIVLYAACLVISRSMSALCFVTCQSAKKDGLQRTFADVLAKRAVIISSAFYLAASFAICIYVDNIRAGVLLLATIILYIYYKHFSNKHFGGITGDLEGYYLQLQELVYLLVVVCMGKLL
jgi:adenosylcobinamide-GDP ribazoletransferase